MTKHVHVAIQRPTGILLVLSFGEIRHPRMPPPLAFIMMSWRGIIFNTHRILPYFAALTWKSAWHEERAGRAGRTGRTSEHCPMVSLAKNGFSQISFRCFISSNNTPLVIRESPRCLVFYPEGCAESLSCNKFFPLMSSFSRAWLDNHVVSPIFTNSNFLDSWPASVRTYLQYIQVSLHGFPVPTGKSPIHIRAACFLPYFCMCSC